MIALNKKRAYRSFVNARDKALDRLHASTQGRVTQALAEALQRIYDGISARHFYTLTTEQMTISGDDMTKSVSQLIDFSFASAQAQMAHEIHSLRDTAMALTITSEKEALRRAGAGKDLPMHSRARVRSDSGKSSSDKMPTGGTVEARISLALNRLKNKILDAVQLSRVLGESTEEALKRVKATFPKLKRITTPKKLTRLVKEADRPRNPDRPFDFDFISEEDWDGIIRDYLKPYQPRIRDPRMYFEVTGDEGLAHMGVGEGLWAGWDIEQQITADFVDTVRKGQVVAAKEQGINDFVWITVFGPTTCESCKWRNGLTSAEIEAKLEDRDDDFDATVPPAHASCRCQLAPMVEELGEEPEELGDFDTWLI